MDLRTQIAHVTEAENLVPGDMVLVGGEGIGVSFFAPVAAILHDHDALIVCLEDGRDINVKHDTEVIRL